MLNKRMFIGLIVVAILVIGSTMAQAVPTLGVATGSYIGDPACKTQASYIDCFTGPYVSGSNEGFVIGSSPTNLLVFSNVTNADIWLLTTSDVFSANSPIINGTPAGAVTLTQGTQFDGYTPTTGTYYGIDLGLMSTANPLPNPPFAPPSFFFESVTLSYTGTIQAGQYFFAVADDNGKAGLQSTGPGKPDDFSPKTTSAVGGPPPSVPEPGVFLLFGTGLMGLGLMRRWLKS